MSWRRYPNGSFVGSGRSMQDGKKEKLIEEYLRSFMLNGTTPEELEETAEEKKRNTPMANA